MLSFLLPALGFAKQWWKLALGIVMGALMCWPLAQCRGEKIGQLRMKAAIATANAEMLKQTNRANELAANQRIIDAIAISRQEQELINAVSQTPDSLPDAARIRLGCERLRRANSANPANLPSECRSGGGVEARPAR